MYLDSGSHPVDILKMFKPGALKINYRSCVETAHHKSVDTPWGCLQTIFERLQTFKNIHGMASSVKAGGLIKVSEPLDTFTTNMV
jgi:hypothetical protein